jgi:chromosome segregation ATPase
LPLYVMAKNSKEGNRTRTARRREALAERGIRPVQVLAPESAHPLIRQAAGLMTRDDDPLEPRAALRLTGGSNEPDEADDSPELHAELAAAKARIAQIEADAERQRKALEAERDAAKSAEAAEREKAQAAATEVKEAKDQAEEALGQAGEAKAALQGAKDQAKEALERVGMVETAIQEAKTQSKEALGRAEKAEAAIRQAKSLPGIKGRLVRWLAGDVLEQQADEDKGIEAKFP